MDKPTQLSAKTVICFNTIHAKYMPR